MLAVIGEGEKKLPPYVVFKRKTMPMETFPKGIEVRVHEKCRLDTGMMHDSFKMVYVRRPSETTTPLILDAFRCHRQSEA